VEMGGGAELEAGDVGEEGDFEDLAGDLELLIPEVGNWEGSCCLLFSPTPFWGSRVALGRPSSEFGAFWASAHCRCKAVAFESVGLIGQLSTHSVHLSG
jgi:hypothetical protein